MEYTSLNTCLESPDNLKLAQLPFAVSFAKGNDFDTAKALLGEKLCKYLFYRHKHAVER